MGRSARKHPLAGRVARLDRDFPFEIALNRSRLGVLPIVTACAPPPCLAHRNSSPLLYCRPQFLGFYLPNTRFSGSLAGLCVYCARSFPLAATVLASFAFVGLSLHGWLVAATPGVQYGRGLRRTTSE
jgi:hypothetical protein